MQVHQSSSPPLRALPFDLVEELHRASDIAALERVLSRNAPTGFRGDRQGRTAARERDAHVQQRDDRVLVGLVLLLHVLAEELFERLLDLRLFRKGVRGLLLGSDELARSGAVRRRLLSLRRRLRALDLVQGRRGRRSLALLQAARRG